MNPCQIVGIGAIVVVWAVAALFLGWLLFRGESTEPVFGHCGHCGKYKELFGGSGYCHGCAYQIRSIRKNQNRP